MVKRELSEKLKQEMRMCNDCIKHRAGTISVICDIHKKAILEENPNL